jgi:hypothetical protein
MYIQKVATQKSPPLSNKISGLQTRSRNYIFKNNWMESLKNEEQTTEAMGNKQNRSD